MMGSYETRILQQESRRKEVSRLSCKSWYQNLHKECNGPFSMISTQVLGFFRSTNSKWVNTQGAPTPCSLIHAVIETLPNSLAGLIQPRGGENFDVLATTHSITPGELERFCFTIILHHHFFGLLLTCTSACWL